MHMGEKRSFRLPGGGTTIRLERAFWSVLDDMAEGQGVGLGTLIGRIDDACRARNGQTRNERNFASCLRVFCLTYGDYTADGLAMVLSPPAGEAAEALPQVRVLEPAPVVCETADPV